MPDTTSLPFLLLPAAAPAQALGHPRIAIAISGNLAAMSSCLLALLRQRTPEGLRPAAGGFGVVLVPEGSAAGTASLVTTLAGRLPFPLRLASPGGPPGRDAGWAWRQALLSAATWTGPQGIVLATKAEAMPEAGWMAAHVAAIGQGAVAVAGRTRPAASPDQATRYAALLEEILSRLDPTDADPWPRHGEESSANLAVTAAALADGVPAGGGAALLAALRRRDAPIRHAPDALVLAPGAAPALERLGPACRRARVRAALRRLWQAGVGTIAPENTALWRLARRLGLPAGGLARHLGARHFGTAWAAVEADCPALLAPQPLAPAGIGAEMAQARVLLGWLRLRQRPWLQRAGGRPAPGSSDLD